MRSSFWLGEVDGMGLAPGEVDLGAYDPNPPPLVIPGVTPSGNPPSTSGIAQHILPDSSGNGHTQSSDPEMPNYVPPSAPAPATIPGTVVHAGQSNTLLWVGVAVAVYFLFLRK